MAPHALGICLKEGQAGEVLPFPSLPRAKNILGRPGVLQRSHWYSSGRGPRSAPRCQQGPLGLFSPHGAAEPPAQRIYIWVNATPSHLYCCARCVCFLSVVPPMQPALELTTSLILSKQLLQLRTAVRIKRWILHLTTHGQVSGAAVWPVQSFVWVTFKVQRPDPTVRAEFAACNRRQERLWQAVLASPRLAFTSHRTPRPCRAAATRTKQSSIGL